MRSRKSTSKTHRNVDESPTMQVQKMFKRNSFNYYDFFFFYKKSMTFLNIGLHNQPYFHFMNMLQYFGNCSVL